jgi:MoaA/NifB/PqqE/SkfB family radical SAM enzyme
MSEVSSVRTVSRFTKMINLPFIIHLHINLGYSCNFSCEYCIQKSSAKNDSLQEEIDRMYDKCERINARLSDYISAATNGRKNPFITFIGGEPSLYPIDRYLEILGESFSIPGISLITNLSTDVEWYRQLNKIVNVNIVASYHGTQMPLDEFKNQCLSILDSTNCTLSIQDTLTGTEENNKDFQDLIEFGKKYDIPIAPRLERIHDKSTGTDYSLLKKNPTLAQLRDSDIFPREIVATYQDGSQKELPVFCNLSAEEFSPHNLWCSIASESLMIRYNGDLIYNLPCKTEEGERICLGNLYEGSEPFQYDGAPFKCNVNYCYCQIPRWLRSEL